MSEKMLGQILDTLQTMNIRLDRIDDRLEKIEGCLDRIENRLEKIEGRIDSVEVDLIKSIKADTKEIPSIKQTLQEIYELSKQISSNQLSFEHQVSSDIKLHSHSIDILNRRQLKLEAEIEHIKQK